jgi:hypothetical protein
MNDITKEAFAKVLTFITNTFYTKQNEKKISVVLNNEDKSVNYYDGKKITLNTKLLDDFGAMNLPRFLVYYHELGHHLYSKSMFNLLTSWQKITTGPLKWKDAYHNLINWIEDFYIERRLVKEHKYLTDVIQCIRKLPPSYDITDIQYAFNYYYVYDTPTPSLVYNDQVTFLNYVNELLTLRDSDQTRFGNGVLSTLTIKHTNETKFAIKIVELYNWCISKNILTEKSVPPLQNPNQHIKMSDQQVFDKTTKSILSNLENMFDKNHLKVGTYEKHSRKVGDTVFKEYEMELHIDKATDLIKEELVHEQVMIDKQIQQIMETADTKHSTLAGLFNSRHSESSIIQSKVKVENFFNPNRLVDQNLFLKKDHTYMNVAIFRDISGSTQGKVHSLMHYVTEHLMRDIPVPVDYYLYASGDISIVKANYIPWENSSKVPQEYEKDPLYQQLNGGTNSDAIADVITDQLSDKWLNIIITDGDLHSLMDRENILGLLKNVFVIAVDSSVEERLLGVSVRNVDDIKSINSVLSTINLDR